VLAQTTYYFWSWLRVTDREEGIDKVSFSVPTGNFGDILAGYYAKRMGLPVGDLIVATNENDILHRFFTTGEYHRRDIIKSLSPSMDICVSSNFERYLYHLAGDDAAVLADWMRGFEGTGRLTLAGEQLQKAQSDFRSARADTVATLDTIGGYHARDGYMLCPHSAVGVSAVRQLDVAGRATVCLATAHFAKFPDACADAVDPLPPSPKELSRLWNMKTRSSSCPNDAKVVQAFMERRIEERKEKHEKRAERSKLFRNLVVVSAVVGIVAIAVSAAKKR